MVVVMPFDGIRGRFHHTSPLDDQSPIRPRHATRLANLPGQTCCVGFNG